jgi:hypothetical protein
MELPPIVFRTPGGALVKLLRWAPLVVLLALPAAVGQDPPKDDKKPPPAREQYSALVKEYTAARSKIIAAYQKADDAEQKKLLEKYQGMGKEYADKFYKLVEENPKDPVAADAVFWILSNATDSPVARKAQDRVKSLVEEMPLKDLASKLPSLRMAQSGMLEAVLKRAEKEETDPQVGALLSWVAMSGMMTNDPAASVALDRLLEKYPDHAAIERVTMSLGYGRMPNAEATLKRILEKASKANVKAAAAMALGRVFAGRTDSLGDKPAEADKVAAEAEKYFEQAISILGKEKASEAENELKALRTLRVGKPVPEIAGADLDGKDFKLSDYRGKVVLLDFWGHW